MPHLIVAVVGIWLLVLAVRLTWFRTPHRKSRLVRWLIMIGLFVAVCRSPIAPRDASGCRGARTALCHATPSPRSDEDLHGDYSRCSSFT